MEEEEIKRINNLFKKAIEAIEDNIAEQKKLREVLKNKKEVIRW